jgi:hypothetical protein
VTWVKTSDTFYRDPVVLGLLDLGAVGITAIALDRLIETWVGENLTDGFVPRGQPARCFAPNDPGPAIRALVDAGLWEERPDGWYLTTWFAPSGARKLPRNPDKATVLKLRRDRQEAGKRGGGNNAIQVEEEGRRDDLGNFTSKQVLGGLNGEELGALSGGLPSNPPSADPTPYPVTRVSVSQGLDENVEREELRARDGRRSRAPSENKGSDGSLADHGVTQPRKWS